MCKKVAGGYTLVYAYHVDTDNKHAICEMLVDGQITVVGIIKEINANIESN